MPRLVTNAEAAWRPRPRDPPVTTATFPLREKSEGKSFNCASAMMYVYVGVDDKNKAMTLIKGVLVLCFVFTIS
jgi:hypothetical protein